MNDYIYRYRVISDAPVWTNIGGIISPSVFVKGDVLVNSRYGIGDEGDKPIADREGDYYMTSVADFGEPSASQQSHYIRATDVELITPAAEVPVPTDAVADTVDYFASAARHLNLDDEFDRIKTVAHALRALDTTPKKES